MKTFLKNYVGIIAIILIALVLRTVQLSVNPPALSWDEVSIGYNAYSIVKTAKDEHGKFLPVDAFAGYGDYKPPLSIYAAVPFIALGGLNEFTVRLPSALFGTLTVLLTFLLVQELLEREKANGKIDATNHFHRMVRAYLPTISALLLAVSPWHINISRAGFEANIALCFVVLGSILILKTQNNEKIWLYGWIPFVLAVYTFNSTRYFVPLLGMGIVIMIKKSIRKQIRFFLVGCTLAFILLLPIIPHLVSKEARLRFQEVNIFSDSSVVLTSNRRTEENGNVWWSKIVFNRRVGFARSFLLHFFDHLQPDFLFIKGDGNPKFSIQDVGQLYMIEAPFLVIGALAIAIEYPYLAILLFYWIMSSFIPASVARETPHALRILNSLPTWQILIGFGILKAVAFVEDYAGHFVKDMPKRLFTYSVIALIVLSYLFSIVYYLHNYYVHYPREFSGEWQYGYKQALEFIRPIEKQYAKIYMTEYIGRAYMYALFYEHIDPDTYRLSKNDFFDAMGFYHVNGFGKYIFFKDLPDTCSGSCLFIVQPNINIKDGVHLQTIRLLNGEPVLEVYGKK